MAAHPEGHQLANAARVGLPLLTIAAADSSAHPVVHATRFPEGLADRIVAHPAAHVLRELFEPGLGVASLGTLTRDTEPSMTFLSIISWVCLRPPYHEASPLRSCLRLVLFHNSISLLILTYRFHVQWTLPTSVDAHAGRTKTCEAMSVSLSSTDIVSNRRWLREFLQKI